MPIENMVAGDDFDIQRDISNVTVSDPIVKAWLTVKASLSDLDAAAALQKVITTALVVGTGHITQDGSEENGNGTASVLFNITAANSAALGTSIRYFYDVQAKSSSGKIYTAHDPDTDEVVSRLQLKQGVTDAIS